MQNQPQNPNDNLNNPLQLKSEQVSYIIEVSIENPDCVAFVQWLQSKGHRASIIDSECSFINGMPEFLDRYYFIYTELYSSFLNEGSYSCSVCGTVGNSKFCHVCGNCVSCEL